MCPRLFMGHVAAARQQCCFGGKASRRRCSRGSRDGDGAVIKCSRAVGTVERGQSYQYAVHAGLIQRRRGDGDVASGTAHLFERGGEDERREGTYGS